MPFGLRSICLAPAWARANHTDPAASVDCPEQFFSKMLEIGEAIEGPST